MSQFIPSSTVSAQINVTEPVNEPVRDYRPGSPEALSLRAEIDRVGSQVRELPHVIGGKELPITDPKPVTSPHDHAHVLGHYSEVDDAVVDSAIEAALAARPMWSQVPWWDRAATLLRAAELVSGKYRDELNATTMLGQSKTFHQAEIDAACEAADFFRYNAHFAQEIYSRQPQSPAGEFNVLDHKGLEGFVLSVTPFNFTAIGANLSSMPALMGNTVVWKPSEKCALSAQVMMRVFEEAGFPPGVINLVHGSGQRVTDRALQHEQFAGMAFTGSTAVFRQLWKKTAQNIESYRSYPRLVGETGGKNAVVVHPSADVDTLLVALVRGAFEFQGQKCSAASRAYIPRSVWKALKDRLVEEIGRIVVGDPTEHATFMGAVIDEAAAQRLSGAIETAKGLPGHSVLTGGTVNTDKGWFVDPTVIVSEDPTSFLFDTEFFGPLLAVHVYDDARWSEILRTVDGTSQYALTCSIFATERLAIVEALATLREVAGMTYVNDKPTGALIGRQSFGGGRGSGTNDKAGSAALLQRFSNARFIKENLNAPTDWSYPYLGD